MKQFILIIMIPKILELLTRVLNLQSTLIFFTFIDAQITQFKSIYL